MPPALDSRSRTLIPGLDADVNAELRKLTNETPSQSRATGSAAPLLEQIQRTGERSQEDNWLNTILASLTDGVIAIDAKGRVRFLNRSAEELTGWTSQEALRKPLATIYDLTNFSADAVNTADLRESPSEAQPAVKRRFFLKQRTGNAIPIESTTARITNAGHESTTVIVFSDITARLHNKQDQTQARERLEEQVHTANCELGHTPAEMRALSAHLMRVQEDERQRVARELHDDLGQRIAAIEFNLDLMQAAPGELPDSVRHRLAGIAGDVAELADALRAVSHGLHSSVISDLGLQTALRALIASHQEQGAEIIQIMQNVPDRVSFEVAVALYRIVQEGLRNSLKHAPGAAIRVELTRQRKDLKLSIIDDGPGFDLARARERGGLGLLSIQERARLVGATFILRTSPRSGTTVSVKVPLDRVYESA